MLAALLVVFVVAGNSADVDVHGDVVVYGASAAGCVAAIAASRSGAYSFSFFPFFLHSHFSHLLSSRMAVL